MSGPGERVPRFGQHQAVVTVNHDPLNRRHQRLRADEASASRFNASRNGARQSPWTPRGLGFGRKPLEKSADKLAYVGADGQRLSSRVGDSRDIRIDIDMNE